MPFVPLTICSALPFHINSLHVEDLVDLLSYINFGFVVDKIFVNFNFLQSITVGIGASFNLVLKSKSDPNNFWF